MDFILSRYWIGQMNEIIVKVEVWWFEKGDPADNDLVKTNIIKTMDWRVVLLTFVVCISS